jgi:PAS domain S-box-containing protein
MIAAAGLRSLAFSWANLSLAVKGVVVIALPLTILLAGIGALHLSGRAEIEAESAVRATFAIQSDIHEVHALLAEAASGVRGYRLTEREAFLEPYLKAEAELPKTLARLRGSIRDPEILQRFGRVEALVEQKRLGLAALREMPTAATGLAASRDEVMRALIENKSVLDALRTEIDAMQVREAQLLADRRARADRERARTLALTVVLAAVGLLGSLAAVYLFSTGIVRRVHLLEGNAARLERGEPLDPLPPEADEIGRLAARLEQASRLLRAREQALREGEERFRLVIEGVRDYGIFALDSAGHVVSWNVGAERIKGWKADEILGQHFSRFYPAEIRDTAPYRLLAEADRDGRVEDEGWRERCDGTRFWANVVITAVRDETGELRGFSKVTRDITERKRAEEALRSARADAEAASRAKSEFLSRMSHELRTPLNAILGFGQLLEMDAEGLQTDQQQAVGQVLLAGRHLLGLIDEVLDIARIESGGYEAQLTPLAAGTLIEEAVALMAPTARTAGVSIHVEQPTAEVGVAGEHRAMVQVLLNLLSNAVKYNAAGGNVWVRSRSLPEGQVALEVEDDGLGVHESVAGRLFTPFDRLDVERRTSAKGAGLGLALSQRLAQAMGAHISHQAPASGKGCLFSVVMSPAVLPRDSADAKGMFQPESGADPHHKDISVLYIEDNQSNVDVVRAALARLRPGIRLVSAGQGRSGPSAGKRAQAQPGSGRSPSPRHDRRRGCRCDERAWGHDARRDRDGRRTGGSEGPRGEPGHSRPAIEASGPSEVPCHRRRSAAAANAMNQGLENAAVLVVDDEPANLSLIARILRLEGIDAVEAHTDPRSALASFARRAPDLVILDLMMPGLDGFQMLESFRRLIPGDQYLPILVLTADTSMDARRRALSLGARDFMTKPFDVHELALRVTNLLETRQLFLSIARRTTPSAW